MGLFCRIAFSGSPMPVALCPPHRGGGVLDKLDAIKAALATPDILRLGLHDFLDWVQAHLIAATDALMRDFFGR